MNKKVLVAFSSKFGYVEEICRTISKKLTEKGLQVDLLDLRKVHKKKWPLIESYHGIVVGSCSTSWNFWENEAKFFVKSNLDKMLTMKKPLGFFLSDPRHLFSIFDPPVAKEKVNKAMLKNFGFIPKYCEDFGPAFDIAHGFKKLSPEARDSIRSSVKSISKETGIEFNYKGFNDFRNWNLIDDYTEKFSEDVLQISGERTCKACGARLGSSSNFCTSCGAALHEDIQNENGVN